MKTFAVFFVLLSGLFTTGISHHLAYKEDDPQEETSIMCVFHTSGEFITKEVKTIRLPAGFDEVLFSQRVMHSTSHQDRRRKNYGPR